MKGSDVDKIVNDWDSGSKDDAWKKNICSQGIDERPIRKRCGLYLDAMTKFNKVTSDDVINKAVSNLSSTTPPPASNTPSQGGKSNVGLFIGIGAVVLIGAGVAIYFVMKPKVAQ
jgi:hypothetical protein